MSKQDQHIGDLIAKSLMGETSSEENSLIDKWVAQSPDNKLAYEQYKKVLNASDQLYQGTSSIDINQEWETFKQNIDKNESSPVIPLSAASNRSTWYKMAAAILLIIGSWYVINYYVNAPSIIEFTTADNIQDVDLPDGTKVTLNKNTTFSYSKAYGKNARSVKLTGEAFFDVTPNKESPFVITTPTATVKVLGTSFNVNSRESIAEVIVATGIVEFLSTGSDVGVVLKAGDQGVLDVESDLFTTTKIDNENFLAWKTHVLNFESTSLESAISSINGAYQANISIAEGVGADCQVSVSFDNQSLDDVLEILKSTLDLEYTKPEGDIVISKAGC